MSELELGYSVASRLLENLNRVIMGKDHILKKILATMIAGGNVLIQDMPGVGKTLLAKTLARSVQANFKRIQFTSDLLPSDIIGVNIFHQQNHEFYFSKGPIFANIVLADEINRANPKVQSALLEAMEENQVTVDNQTYKLSDFFFVIATQNPSDDEGTFDLPMAQLDRFWINLALGYPEFETEIILLRLELENNLKTKDLPNLITENQILQTRQSLDKIHISKELLEKTVTAISRTRNNSRYMFGASPRAILQLLKISRAMALIQGRDFVTLDDLIALTVPVLSHRLTGFGSNDLNYVWN